MLAAVVYLLGAMVTLACSALLLRAYSTGQHTPLLLWSGVCFALLAISNALLFVDLILLSDKVTLYPWRLASASIGMVVLTIGLIFESE